MCAKILKIFKGTIALLLLLNILCTSGMAEMRNTHYRERKLLKSRSFKLINNKTKVLPNPLIEEHKMKSQELPSNASSTDLMDKTIMLAKRVYNSSKDGNNSRSKDEINSATDSFSEPGKSENVGIATNYFMNSQMNGLCMSSASSSSSLEPPTAITDDIGLKSKTSTEKGNQDTKFYPFKGVTRPLSEGEETYGNNDWKPIVYALATDGATTASATTAIIKSTVITKPTEATSKFGQIKPEVIDEPVVTTVKAISKEEDFVTDLREKLDSLIHNNNYQYPALPKKEKPLRKSFPALIKGVTDDSTTFQPIGQRYNSRERENRKKEETLRNAKIQTVDNINVTTNNEINNSTVAPDEEKAEIRKAINTAETDKKRKVVEEKRSTWLEISNSNSTTTESNQSNQSNNSNIEQQLQYPLMPLKINEITWPLRLSSVSSLSPQPPPSSSSLAEEEVKKGPEISALYDKHNNDEGLVTIHVSSTTRKTDNNPFFDASTSSSSSSSSDTLLSTSKTTICVPMMVHEKVPTNPQVFMDVERVVCFPLPPEMNFNFHELNSDDQKEESEEEEVEAAKKSRNDIMAEEVKIIQTEFIYPELVYSKASSLQRNDIHFSKGIVLLLMIVYGIFVC